MADASTHGIKSYQECAKQVLTVSAGVMAVTMTFWQRLEAPAEGEAMAPTFVVLVSWLLFLATDFFALWVLMATTGSLLAFDRKANNHPMTDADKRVAEKGDVTNINIPFAAMLFSLFLALLCTAFAAA